LFETSSGAAIFVPVTTHYRWTTLAACHHVILSYSMTRP
jgi:hypothetical protein